MTVDRRTFIKGAAAGAGLAFSGPFGKARAQSSVDFSGETIEWIVPFSEGGGTDAWTRFYAPHLSKYLPGQPDVVVRNVPGGGSITGTNNFAKRAEPDGLSLIGTSGSTQLPFLLGDPRVQYDYSNFTPVLVSPTGGVVYLPPEFEVMSTAELGKIAERELVYASQGATSLDLVPMLAFHLLGLNVRYVFGMTGRGDGRLAFERGEATIDYQTSSAYLANVVPLVEQGKAVPIFSWGVLDEQGNVQRDPTFPDLPHFVEAYETMHGSKPSGVAFDAYLAFFGAGFAAQKPAMLLKATPPEIVEAYRQAFIQAVADPEMQANKGTILGEYPQATGQAAVKLFEIATTIAPEAREWVRNYLIENYNVEL
ncbi:MAG: Bug family tripartite tricarboxylate transporter substrate binding protein [Geminicoccaceae bacterium]